MSDDNNLDKPLDEAEGFDENVPFDEFDGGGGEGTLGELFRSNPMVKVGVIVGAFVVLVGGVMLFGGKAEKPASSAISKGSDISEAPGTDEVSESYRKAVEEKNVQNVEEAIREGTSALPVPVSSPQGRVDANPLEGNEEDPLERWRRIQEERQRRSLQQTPPTQQAGDPNAAAIETLSQAMAQQMGSVLENNQPQKSQFLQIAPANFLDKDDENAGNGNGNGNGTEEEQVLNVIIPAGTVEYAQLLTEANTDAPGPILAEIASGPLSGSRLLGSFQATEEYLVLSFDTVVVDGISYDVEAVALDPKTTNPGLVTDIDHRYLKRVILPAASAFIAGVAESVADTGSSQAVTNNGPVTTSQEEPDTKDSISKGFEKASEKVTDLLDEEADRTKVMIKVASGTPLGVLFIEPVTKDEQNQ